MMQQQTTADTRMYGNIYGNPSGVGLPNSDIYSSIYDTVAPTPNSVIYERVPIANSIDLVYNNINQSVIYDEVSNEDESLRPSRPAPNVPLSAQQIQRRLDKIAQQNGQVYALMQDLGDDATDDEVRNALEAVNWDRDMAIRHFKIERLCR